jgi:hypothetical protein
MNTSISLKNSDPPTAPHLSSSIIRGWYSRPNGGRRMKWTQPLSLNYKNRVRFYFFYITIARTSELKNVMFHSRTLWEVLGIS